MPTFKDAVMIEGHAVEVTVIYPDGVNVLNVQELAERAWRSVNKTITIGKVTVKCGSSGASSLVASLQFCPWIHLTNSSR
jgi:hypothetical protein